MQLLYYCGNLLKRPLIPNAFSPNGDGVNDTWVIDNLAKYPNAMVTIYNRYGVMLFNTVGYTKPWNGTFNGKPVPVGTYYYVIEPHFGIAPMSGYVVVLR